MRSGRAPRRRPRAAARRGSTPSARRRQPTSTPGSTSSGVGSSGRPTHSSPLTPSMSRSSTGERPCRIAGVRVRDTRERTDHEARAALDRRAEAGGGIRLDDVAVRHEHDPVAARGRLRAARGRPRCRAATARGTSAASCSSVSSRSVGRAGSSPAHHDGQSNRRATDASTRPPATGRELAQVGAELAHRPEDVGVGAGVGEHRRVEALGAAAGLPPLEEADGVRAARDGLQRIEHGAAAGTSAGCAGATTSR